MEEEWNTMMDNRDRIDASGTPDKALKCPKCNWRFGHPKTLANHMIEKHKENDEETATATCVYCATGGSHPKLYTYRCEFKPYKCEICDYTTGAMGNLTIHMRSAMHLKNVQRSDANKS